MKWFLIISVILLLSIIPQRCNMIMGDTIKDVGIKKEEEKIIPDIVTLTTYSIHTAQTDSTPLLTASGYEINPKNPKKHRIIAVSRDLKQKFKFGEKVEIRNAGKYNGIYTVRDLMHHRWKKKIDILINPDDEHIKLRKVKLYKLKK